MKKIITTLSFAALIVVLASCEKVIKVDLNSANPRLVVEGCVTSEPGPYTIRLSKTINYFDENIFPAVTGAEVVISDDAGNSEILVDKGDGIYETTNLIGKIGRTYYLKIRSEGKEYNSFSTMQDTIPIDSLTIEKLNPQMGGGGPFGGGGMDGGKRGDYRATVVFSDPPNVKNYSRIMFFVNGVGTGNMRLVDDTYLRDMRNRVSSGSSLIFKNDTVRVELISFDEATYSYFTTLDNILSGGGMGSSPQNPISNFTNDAQGYFAAYAVNKRTAIVQ